MTLSWKKTNIKWMDVIHCLAARRFHTFLEEDSRSVILLVSTLLLDELLDVAALSAIGC